MRDVQEYIHKFTGKEAGYFLLTLAAALALWLFVAAGYRREAVSHISQTLLTINSYKAEQIAAWREEHSREALRLSRHTVFGEVVAEEMARPGSRRAQLTTWLKDQLIQKQYISLAFLSPKGAVVAATPGFKAGTEKYFMDVFTQAALKKTGLLTDLYLTADGRPGAAMIIPMAVGGRGGKPVTLLVINIDPEKKFYPIVKTAPQFFASAETLLVRKEGERVLFLNPLDHAGDAAMKFTRPVYEEQLPAAAAIRGVTGFFPGIDYRGVKVFSAISPVPGSDWAVITKIDRDIILAPVKTREHLALALILMAAGLIYFVVYVILRARRLAAEESLAESEARYRALVDASGDGILTADLETMRFNFVNPAICRMLGYTAEELTRLSVNDIHPKDALPAVIAELEAQARGEKTLAPDLPCLRKDGTVFYADIATTPVTIGGRKYNLGIFRDITERRLTEIALKKYASELQEAHTVANMGSYSFDLKADKWVSSAQLDRIFGLESGEYKKDLKLWTEIVHPEDRAGMVKYFTEYVAGAKHNFDRQYRILRLNDKAERWVHGYGKLKIDEAGNVAEMYGLIQDITEAKLAELQLDRLNRNLAARKQEMENFLYITTHDLRSPLVNIQGFAQNLVRYIQELQDGLAPEKLPQAVNETVSSLAGGKIPEALKYVLESSRKMDSLISSLLKVARLGRVEMKPEILDMNDLVKKATDSIRFQGDKAEVSIKTGVLPPCKADQTAVSQIFANLLGNAIKYRSSARTLEISVTGEVRGARAFYTVADNGSGITARDLPRIWDLFFRGGNPGMEGEGIGLTVVKYMVEKNGGSIKVESKERQGSVFCLELPAAGGQNE